MGTNTGIGIGIGIPFKNNVLGEGKPYLPPEIKDSLKAVVIAYGKTNNDSDRAIVKNLVDASNPFVISNAAFKLNSGFGGFVEDFTSWDRIDSSTAEISNDGSKIKCINTILNVQYLFNSINKDIPSFKVKISNFTKGNIAYYYRKEDGTEAFLRIEPSPLDKVLELPKSYNTVEGGTDSRGGFYSSNINIGVTITQIPSFEGAFVTDGINDLITSTKTVQEMLGGSNEITVVSMIANLDSRQILCNSNYSNTNGYNVRNTLEPNGVISMLGYTDKNGTTNNINLIMGDKNSIKLVDKVNFNSDYVFYPAQYYTAYYQVAWYWTIIANKVLTTDEINQVIAYFNLDRTLNPDILCNVKKQGITNENHAEFGDKLIDFSGNSRDIQLNNLAWDGDSGIGKYNYPNWKVTATIANTYSTIVNYPTVNGTYSINVNGVSELMQSIGLHLEIKYTTSTGIIYNDIKQDGVYSYILPDGATNLTLRFGGIPGIVNEPCNITITQIPSHAGALCLDGVNDFGKVTGLPIYKDYTVIADYERLKINIGVDSDSPILSKSESVNLGAFMFNTISSNGDKVSYSFGRRNIINADDTIRKIFYQSKYINDGQDINIESTFVDSDKLWLGTYRDSDYRFISAAIYSLMSFPYSMSEFLIERQLKKHKLGTLYPDMVEFRPVIKSNVLLDAKPTFVIRGTSTYLNAGDYVPENSQIWVSIKMNNIADRITKFTVNGKTIDIPENAYSEVTLQYGFPFVIDKSPQKISITIEQDENYVLFNPVINSNYDNYKLTFHLREYEKLINIGDYIPKGTYIRANLYLKNDIDELVTFTFNGVNIDYAKSPVLDTAYNIRQIYNYDSPQEVNITIDEYIRYEDIVQPYPVLLRFNDENGNEVSWGGKFKVGSNITRIGSAADSNLLPNIYNIFGLLLNGNEVTSSKVIVEKTMVFKAKSAYIFDNNEPKCILSPRLLRIPNSSYKILGYIPDISGHGNHGIIHNSAYAEGSGVNEDGSYQFDGVDDFVTIPTTVGGKQVLMKVNLPRLNEIIYDQRKETNTYTFAIITIPSQIAYDQRNSERITYIDGILNTNIIAEQLMGVTHNIVVINSKANLDNTRSPILGRDINGNNWSRMRIYDFMLFDNISTDDKIKELNEYVGIEAKVELPPYYWDAYGKTNLDADKATIQQRGVSVGDYDLTNYNHAYEGMSGYNGYPVVFGIGKTYGGMPNADDFAYTVSPTTVNVTKFNITHGFIYSYLKRSGELETQNLDYPSYKIKVTGLEKGFGLHYSYLKNPSDANLSAFGIGTDGTYTIPKSFASDGSLINNNVWIGFIFTGTAPESCNVTIEVLPEYENGLAYDGVSDFTNNKNIPILTDFTFIIKREILSLETNEPMLVIKGDKVYNNGIGNAFILEHNSKGVNYVYSYGKLNQIERDDSKIICLTPESYNGNPIIKGENGDNLGLILGKYWKGIIYKTILYSKTISLLEINFLKNLMEKDEIIDLNNPIFIKNE